MVYVSMPLPAVSKPVVENQFRYGLFLIGSCVIYWSIVSSSMYGIGWIADNPRGMRLNPWSTTDHILFTIIVILIGLIAAAVLTLVQAHFLDQERHYTATYNQYLATAAEAREWEWKLLGVGKYHGYHVIDCLHDSLFLRIQVPSHFVYEKNDPNPRITFGTVSFKTSGIYTDTHDDGRLWFGGIVNLYFETDYGPPPLREKYEVYIAPRAGLNA